MKLTEVKEFVKELRGLSQEELAKLSLIHIFEALRSGRLSTHQSKDLQQIS